jgi:hypothetical protein
LHKKRSRILRLALVIVSYLALATGVVFVARSGFLTPEQAALTLVALFGLYFGFGVLILIYRLINRLD